MFGFEPHVKQSLLELIPIKFSVVAFFNICVNHTCSEQNYHVIIIDSSEPVCLPQYITYKTFEHVAQNFHTAIIWLGILHLFTLLT